METNPTSKCCSKDIDDQEDENAVGNNLTEEPSRRGANCATEKDPDDG